MKNKRILHSRQEVKIYQDFYKPSFNVIRFAKSILGVLIFGRTSVAHSYLPIEKKRFK